MIEPFEQYAIEYDHWFEKNKFIYLSELELIKSLIPKKGVGLEIGIGTGRFAVPLKIKVGIELSNKMAEISRSKGLNVVQAKAEKIPFNDNFFDYALLVTTICFVDDIKKSFKEIYRILKPDGVIIIGFIDKNSYMGKKYQREKTKSKFYKHARFFDTDEVIRLLTENNFKEYLVKQTLFTGPDNLTGIDKIVQGYGKGSFVGIKAMK
ncbi:MAG: class I SAM-dependent methyltransferase [Candidatus Margulisbacteria bacterium]|nr:class I SAM-dependent methyltransferase [Candidatus Margulisiibacteriota bacterium]